MSKMFTLSLIKDAVDGLLTKYQLEKAEVLNNEDFCVDDYAGGNVDDAFWFGVDVGEVQFANELLTKLDKLLEEDK